MQADRSQRMDIARTAARLAAVAMEEGERNFEIVQAIGDLNLAVQEWRKKCSPASSED